MNNKIEEIKSRLAAATPSPWNLEGKEIWRRGGVKGYGGDYVWITDFNGFNKNNAVLIANAPDDIAYLLSEYDRMREALEWYAGGNHFDVRYLGLGVTEAQVLDRGERARKALTPLSGCR